MIGCGAPHCSTPNDDDVIVIQEVGRPGIGCSCLHYLTLLFFKSDSLASLTLVEHSLTSVDWRLCLSRSFRRNYFECQIEVNSLSFPVPSGEVVVNATTENQRDVQNDNCWIRISTINRYRDVVILQNKA